ncbi:MAG: UvrB/UvrC protein [Acidobacteriaceae bacterium]|nr:UvrB/UvrC protein [Acidobacteriaceae bacterium]
MLARALTFSANCEDNFFEEIPAAPAVFLLRAEGEPYVSKTANLRRRLQRLLGKPAEQSKRLNLRERVSKIEFTLTGSDFESQLLLYRLLREAFPKTYAARLRLRPAPLVKLHLENEYPRASVTTRLGKLAWGQPPSAVHSGDARHSGGPSDRSGQRPEDSREQLSPHGQNLYYGPFPSRAAAEKFASDALDFFKMRRCVDDLHPDPSFPGCVYSEMKMCLAPCYKGCTDAEYHAEVARVQAFFDSGGESLSRELAAQRERASAQLAFEEAATIHTKLDKLKHLLSQLPEIVQPIDRLAAIIVQPSGEAGRVELFHFADATLRGPIPFSIEQSGEPQSMESRLHALIEEFPSGDAGSVMEHTEHLAILKRWYYRSRRIGEIFFADEKGQWPMRRMGRGIARVYRGEKVEEAISRTLAHD